MRPSIPFWLMLLAFAAPAPAQQPEPSRGQLLYTTHCITCHTEQMHWRTLGRARNWDTLKAQVRRWQREARLQWSEEDIDAVATYLNETIYGFPQPSAQAGRPSAPATLARR